MTWSLLLDVKAWSSHGGSQKCSFPLGFKATSRVASLKIKDTQPGPIKGNSPTIVLGRNNPLFSWTVGGFSFCSTKTPQRPPQSRSCGFQKGPPQSGFPQIQIEFQPVGLTRLEIHILIFLSTSTFQSPGPRHGPGRRPRPSHLPWTAAPS